MKEIFLKPTKEHKTHSVYKTDRMIADIQNFCQKCSLYNYQEIV